MTSIARVAILTLALTWTALWCQPSFAQPPSDQASKIQFSYIPPKSLKYLPVFNRVQQFKLLEQLSEFLSPLRLPHKFSMVTIECGFVNAQYQPSRWRIELCYEYVEAVERVAPKQGQPSEFSFEEVVVGGLVGVLLHELGHAVIDMLNIPVFGREEDAADEISTFIALQFSPDVARTIVRGNAYVYKVWYGFGAPAYFDEHGTGLQRYYNSLCIAHGSERPELFKEFLDKGELPKERAAGCQREYQQVRSAFEKTILPFVDREQMKKVQAREWLKLNPQQTALLKQQQQAPRETYTFAVCNQSSVTRMSFAVMVQLVEDPQRWQALGWYSIPDNGCELIGTFRGDRLFWYAEALRGKDRVVWSAPDTDQTASKQCIHPSNAFQLPQSNRCQSGQVLVNFRRWQVDPSLSNLTLNFSK